MSNIGIALGTESELYRLRTQPHLYDEWHVDFTLGLEWVTAARNGTVLADCHRCRSTSHVAPDDERCPMCNRELT